MEKIVIVCARIYTDPAFRTRYTYITVLSTSKCSKPVYSHEFAGRICFFKQTNLCLCINVCKMHVYLFLVELNHKTCANLKQYCKTE